VERDEEKGAVFLKAAYWNRLLWLITAGCGVAVLVAVVASAARGPAFRWVGLAMVLVLGICGLFAVRGYEVSREAVVVRRLLWRWRLPLEALQSVEADPRAMAGSLRLWGVGGCFSWSGLYWNRRLGRYWAAVTDPAKAVVLRWDRKVVVLSPDEPERLLAAVRQAVPAAGAAGNPGFSGGFHLD
jgi:hypothetical protein